MLQADDGQEFELLDKAKLDLERHGGRTSRGVAVRVPQRLLAPTTASWRNPTPASQLSAH
ncbi:hypothetical protein [Streptomyces sp. R41]|uniref:Uncharacterized protein n=1 Tax=Streptomyces sp. R41 TaxID=3238632 RepID=A0AB39RUD3_9ACTN